MGSFSSGWRDTNREKALAAVAALKSDGQLFRAARDAADEAVAIAAASRIKDKLLLEELALREPHAAVGAAGMALLGLAASPKEFQNIWRMLRDEGSANGSRMAAVLGAAVDQTDDLVVFAKLLVCLSPRGRDTCLKRCKKGDGFLALVLRQAASIFERAPENVQKML